MPDPLKPLLDWLVENAPGLAQTGTFPDTLGELVAHAGTGKLEDVVGGDTLPATLGSGALLRVIEDVGSARKRVAIYAAAAAKQSQQWNVLSEATAGWDDPEWKRRLAALGAREPAAIAELTPEGGTLPACVVELLTSARPELRRAGVQAIGKVRPRDESLIRHLREIASDGGQLGREGTQVLDELGSIFNSELDEASSLSEVSALLPLLGAVSRPAVIIRSWATSAPRLSTTTGTSTGWRPGLCGRPANPCAGTSRRINKQPWSRCSRARARRWIERLGMTCRQRLRVSRSAKMRRWRSCTRKSSHTGLWAKERDRGKAGRPRQLENLDIICERLTRAAYLKVGDSENIKAQIRGDETKPDYGAVITALGSTKLSKQEANLKTLHDLRCNRTFAHIGSDASDADMVRATESFKEATKAIIGALKGATRGTS